MSMVEASSRAMASSPYRVSHRTPGWGYRSADGSVGRAEEARLVRQARNGNREAKERLVQANIRLVYKLARRYRCRSHTLEDLVQEGIVGLIYAIDRFDEGLGYRLSTYALHWIRQSIARAVEQNDRLIHVPLQASTDTRRLMRLREEQQMQLGRPLTQEELAQATGIAEERVVQLLGTAEDAVSLEALIGVEQDTALSDFAQDPSATDPEDHALLGIYRQHLRCLLSDLRPREQWIVKERFGLDGRHPRTLEELSQCLHISRERVRQIEARAMQKLRHALSATQWDQ